MRKAIYTDGANRGKVISIYSPYEVFELIGLSTGTVLGMLHQVKHKGVLGYTIQYDVEGAERVPVISAVSCREAVFVPELDHLEGVRVELMNMWDMADRNAEECFMEGLDELAMLYGARCKAIDDCLKIIREEEF